MSKFEELIPGKVYQCFSSYNKKNRFFLRWGNSETEVRDSEKSSIFIFLKFIDDGSGGFTIKGIVNGKMLYAARCGKADIIFKEMTNEE